MRNPIPTVLLPFLFTTAAAVGQCVPSGHLNTGNQCGLSAATTPGGVTTTFRFDRIPQPCGHLYLEPTISSTEFGAVSPASTAHLTDNWTNVPVGQTGIIPLAIIAFSSNPTMVTLPSGCLILDPNTLGASTLVPSLGNFQNAPAAVTILSPLTDPALVGAVVFVQHAITDQFATTQFNPPLPHGGFEFGDIIQVTVQSIL